MAKAIVFEFSIKNMATGEMKNLAVQARSAEEALKKVGGAAGRMANKASSAVRQNIQDYANLTIALDGVANATKAAAAIVNDLVDAYSVQEEAETKLATVMIQRMNATEQTIQSIKDLASAQQAIGVIGDEVQLAGAQQIATFLNEADSIKILLPAMNDLVAQQKGFKATGADAVTVANMMGKALTGQTSALRRVGIIFSEAQERILKYGTEAQRAAILAEIITANVGHMNARLAQTDAGKIQQLANNLGDVKEYLGGIVRNVQPFLTLASTSTTASTGFIKLANGVKSAYMWFRALSKVWKLSVIGLATTAITALCLTLKKLTTSTKQQIEISEAQKRAQDVVNASYNQAKSAIDINILRLKEFNGTRVEEKKLVAEMNSTYGPTMGYYSSIAEWYRALTENSAAYCRQLTIQTQLQQLAQQAADIDMQRRQLIYNDDGSLKQYSKKRKTKLRYTGNAYTGYTIVGTEEIEGSSDVEKVNAQIKDLSAQYLNLQKQMTKLAQEAANIKLPEIGSLEPPTFTPEKNEKPVDLSIPVTAFTTLDQFAARLDALRKQQTTATSEQYQALQAEIDRVEWLMEAFKNGQPYIKGVSAEVSDCTDATRQLAAAMGGLATAARPAELSMSQGLKDYTASAEQRKKKQLEEARNQPTVADVIGRGLQATAGMLQNVTSLLGEAAGAWVNYAASVLQAVASAMPALAAFAAGQAAAADAKWLGAIGAAAAIVSVLAAFAAIPKFAKGGIAYGPTVGMFGEYAGASSNPEVVAPLSRLRELIEPAQTQSVSLPETITLRAHGSELKAVIDTRSKFCSRI